MRKKSFPIAVALGLVLGLGATATRADVTNPSLDSLITTGGSLTVGNLVFSNFGFHGNTGNFPAPADITVGQIPPAGTDALGNSGIRFGMAGFDNPVHPTDFTLTFEVVNTAGGPLFNDVHLGSNLSIAGTPAPGDSPFGNIVETITTPGVAGPIAQINNSVTATSSSLSASSTFTPPGPFQTLFVTKDIELSSTPGAITTVSFIDQSFSTLAVPEPGSLVLMGLGGLGLLGYAWKQKRVATA
jgi:hypothetical protein